MTGKPGSLTSTAFNTGVIMERERIIKLLEDELLSDDDTAWQTRDWQEVERQQYRDEIVKEAIALINGESQNYNKIVILSPKRVGGNKHVSHCNDYGCHGCWDCDCEDCLEGENK